ncbi:MAG: type II toxin-antitoxin system prevent-host-death family antitoxin [Kribbellaceae bacterium]
MGQIAVRVLNQDTAGVLARVKRGEEIEITERGVVIARIVPASASPVAHLVALIDWLSARSGELLVASTLVEVELPRAIRRSEPEVLSVPGIVRRLALYEIDEMVRATAASYDDPMIRSRQAIHLATADAVLGDDLTAFVTYDKRLLATADALGLPVASPGA